MKSPPFQEYEGRLFDSRGSGGLTTVESRSEHVRAPAAQVIWLSPLPKMGAEALGVSRCLCSKHTARRYGRYNGGMIFARTADVLEPWRVASRTSRYYEQSAIEDLVREFPYFHIHHQADLAALYLLRTHSHDGQDHVADLELANDNATVLWQKRPLLSAHAHIIPGPNFAKWAAPATTRLRDVLAKSAIREDLCATHAAFCDRPTARAGPHAPRRLN